MARIRQTASSVWGGLNQLFTWKVYVLTAVATIAFANVVLALFGNTIPNAFLMVFGNTIPNAFLIVFGNTIPNAFLMVFGNMIPGVFQTAFKVAASGVILGAVFVFAMAWLLKAKPHSRPRAYRVVIFDVYGRESAIDGLRLNFRNHDVAWSYMKQYKASYPLHNFALVSDNPESRPTIYRYI